MGKEANLANKSIPKNVDTDWIIIIYVRYTMRMQSCIILKIYITNDETCVLTYMSTNVAGFNRKYYRNGHVALRPVAY